MNRIKKIEVRIKKLSSKSKESLIQIILNKDRKYNTLVNKASNYVALVNAKEAEFKDIIKSKDRRYAKQRDVLNKQYNEIQRLRRCIRIRTRILFSVMLLFFILIVIYVFI